MTINNTNVIEHPNLIAALAAVQAELPKVIKTETAEVQMKTGGKFKYAYANLADVLAAVLPITGRHGLALTQTIEFNESGRMILRSTLAHTSGEKIDSLFPIAGGTPQEIGSQLTYGKRYTALGLVGVAPEDDDDGQVAQSAPKFEPRQYAKTRSAPAAKGTVRKPPPAMQKPKDDEIVDAEIVVNEAPLASDSPMWDENGKMIVQGSPAPRQKTSAIISDKQIKFIIDLGKGAGLDEMGIEGLLVDMDLQGEVPEKLADLTKQQASDVISWLKDQPKVEKEAPAGYDESVDPYTGQSI